jgi:hypothetical protein
LKWHGILWANTDDVGEQFVDEARRMHYGEAPERAIRGIASPVEAVALLEEGIAVLPFALPESLKKPTAIAWSGGSCPIALSGLCVFRIVKCIAVQQRTPWAPAA